MALTYKAIAKKPVIFLRLTGVKVEQFQEIAAKVEPEWYKNIEAKKKRHGRTGNLKTFEDKLLALMLYYRTYITHDFRIRKEGKPPPGNSEKYADSGYQGWQKIACGVGLPFKGTKKRPLTKGNTTTS